LAIRREGRPGSTRFVHRIATRLGHPVTTPIAEAVDGGQVTPPTEDQGVPPDTIIAKAPVLVAG
jgi:hypothetical protein